MIPILMVLVLILASGCTSGPAESEGLPVWTLQEVFRKDGMSDPMVPLNRVLAAGVAENGDIYLTQWETPEVLVMDSAGVFKRTIGGAGQGPGEFFGPGELGWLSDTLWVGDPRRSEIELFDDQDAPLATIRFTIQPQDGSDLRGLPVGPYSLLPDGTVLARPLGVPIGSAVTGRLSDFLYLRTDWDGNVLDTLAAVPIRPEDYLTIPISGGGGIMTSHAVRAGTVFRVLEGDRGILLAERPVPSSADSAVIRITRRGLEGDTLDEGMIVRPAVEVPEWFKERWYARFTGAGEGSNPMFEGIEAKVREVEFPTFLPGAMAVKPSTDGSIWIETPLARPDSSSWLVIDEHMKPIARASAPAGFSILHAGGDQLLGVIQGALDVPVLLRFQIIRN